MRRRQLLGVAAALGTAAVAGACGVPSRSGPVRLGGAPTSVPQPIGAQEPPKPAAAASPRELVVNYLKAAAGANYAGGDKPDALPQAQQRARDYLTANAGRVWQPGKDLIVVRVRLGGSQLAADGTYVVDAQLDPLGVLNERGALEPPPPQPPPQLAPLRHKFSVVQVGTELRLGAAPPDLLLLSDEGLQELYMSRPIYFWDQADSPTLVPDQRYLPKSVTSARQPGEIVRWLTAGPSSWLGPVLQPLPEVEFKEISFDQGRLVVNLSSKARSLDKAALRRLADQLRWSTGQSNGLELSIEGTPAGVSADNYQQSNLAFRTDASAEPERFCIVAGQVQVVELAGATPTEIIRDPRNGSVVVAAISQTKSRAALVVHEGRSRQLWLGSLVGSGDTRKPVYTPTNLAGQAFSRPVWLARPVPRVLVAVDGRLYAVTPGAPAGGGSAGSAAAPAVPAPGAGSDVPVSATVVMGLTTPVTAVSVSMDGRRIALVADHQVIVAPLLFDPQLGIGEPYRVVKTDLSDQRAVGWSDETKLLVGGSPIPGTKSTLVEITIDGSGQQSVPRSVDATESLVVDMLSVLPAGPQGNARFAMFDTNGAAYVVYGQQVGPLTSARASPSPYGGSARPAAPFFLDTDRRAT